SMAWRFTISSASCVKSWRRYSNDAALGDESGNVMTRPMILMGKSQGYSMNVGGSDELTDSIGRESFLHVSAHGRLFVTLVEPVQLREHDPRFAFADRLVVETGNGHDFLG